MAAKGKKVSRIVVAESAKDDVYRSQENAIKRKKKIQEIRNGVQ